MAFFADLEQVLITIKKVAAPLIILIVFLIVIRLKVSPILTDTPPDGYTVRTLIK